MAAQTTWRTPEEVNGEVPPPFVGQRTRAKAVLPDLAFDAPQGDGASSAQATTLFVGNVDTSVADIEAVLLELFTQMGDVLRVSVPREKVGGRLRGFAFCDFADPRSAQYAIAVLDGLRIGSRNIRLDLKGGSTPVPRATPPSLPPVPPGSQPSRPYEAFDSCVRPPPPSSQYDDRVGRTRCRDEPEFERNSRRRSYSPPRQPGYESRSRFSSESGFGRRGNR